MIILHKIKFNWGLYMALSIDKEAKMAYAGFIAPFVGFVVSSVLTVFGSIPPEQMGTYSAAIWSAILIIEIAGVVEDFESIKKNGISYASGFLFSQSIIYGIDLKIIVLIIIFTAVVYLVLVFAQELADNRY